MSRKVGGNSHAKKSKGQQNVPGHKYKKLRSIGMLPSQIRNRVMALKKNETPYLKSLSALSQLSKRSIQKTKMNIICRMVKTEFLLNKAAKKKREKGQIQGKKN